MDKPIEIEFKILFYSVPLNIDITTVEAVLTDDEILKSAIDDYADELEREDIEIFKRDRNMLVTESGYKIAIFESSATKVIE